MANARLAGAANDGLLFTRPGHKAQPSAEMIELVIGTVIRMCDRPELVLPGPRRPPSDARSRRQLRGRASGSGRDSVT